jgi:hypothetical protein
MTHKCLGIDLSVLCLGLDPRLDGISGKTGLLGSLLDLLDKIVEILWCS